MKNLAQIHLRSGVPLRDLEEAENASIEKPNLFKTCGEAIKAYYASFGKIREYPSTKLRHIVQGILYHWPNEIV